MNPSEPDWYEALRDEPLRNKTFTSPLANRIRERIHSPVKSTSKSRIRWVGGVLVIAAGIIIFSQNDALFQKLITTTPSEIVSSDETIQGIPSDDNLIKLINGTAGENKRHILHKEMIDDKSMWLFTRTNISDQRKMVWEVGYTNWASGKLAWEKEGSNRLEIDLVSDIEYSKAVDNGQILRFQSQQIQLPSGSSSQLIYGSIANQRVSEIIISGVDHIRKEAKLINDVHGGYSLWFVSLPNTLEHFTIEALDKDGGVLAALTN